MGSKSQDIRALIKEWLDEKPARDITLLSRKTGVPYNTLRRIWNAEGEPNCNTALALLSVVGQKEQCYAYLANHFPDAARFHTREFGEDSSVKVSAYNDSLRPFIEDFTSFFVLNMAYARIANKKGIQAVFGSQGLEKAHALVDAGKLTWDNNDNLVPVDGCDFFFYENKLDLLKACEHILALSRGNNGFPVSIIGAVTSEELDRIKFLLREFCSAVKDIVMDSKGTEHFVTLSMVFAMLENEVSA